MVRVRFTDQASANRFASEVRRLYGADRWRNLAVGAHDATVVVPADLPNLSELAQRFGGSMPTTGSRAVGEASAGS